MAAKGFFKIVKQNTTHLINIENIAYVEQSSKKKTEAKIYFVGRDKPLTVEFNVALALADRM